MFGALRSFRSPLSSMRYSPQCSSDRSASSRSSPALALRSSSFRACSQFPPSESSRDWSPRVDRDRNWLRSSPPLSSWSCLSSCPWSSGRGSSCVSRQSWLPSVSSSNLGLQSPDPLHIHSASDSPSHGVEPEEHLSADLVDVVLWI